MDKNSESAQYQWIHVTNSASFPPRDGAGALIYREKMWLIGGWNPADKETNPIHSNCNNEVWNSADGIIWTQIKPNTHVDKYFDPRADWEARHTAGYGVYQDKMWIVGGDPLLGHYQLDVWNSADGATWYWVNEGNPVPWGPRALHHTVVFEDMILVIGGQTLPQFAPENEIFYSDVWNTADGIEWQKIEITQPFAPCRGMIGGSAVFQGRLWLLGGGTYATPTHPQYTYNNDVWSSADGKNWERHVEHAPWRGRVYHDVVVFDSRLWVLAGLGSHDRNMNDIWFSTDGQSWHEVPNTPWKERHAASVFVHENALWIMGGCHMDRDIWKLVRK